MATFYDKWTTVKPYVVGMVIGAVAVPVIGIWRGDLVTAGTHSSQVTTAAVEAKATICEALARDQHAADGGVSLVGNQNRQAREALARQFAVMPGQNSVDEAVRRACTTRLARAV